MAEDSNDADRAELLAARENLLRQIELLENPLRAIDRTPLLIAKLRAMLDEIEGALGEEPS